MDGRVKLNFKLKKSVPVVLQTEVAECGLASLAMVAAFHGYSIDLPNLRKLFCAGQQGMNLQQMIEVAGKLNLASRPCNAQSMSYTNSNYLVFYIGT